ncbi:hypothetical protein EMPG_13090, partial [Blastomyces silverae]
LYKKINNITIKLKKSDYIFIKYFITIRTDYIHLKYRVKNFIFFNYLLTEISKD